MHVGRMRKDGSHHYGEVIRGTSSQNEVECGVSLLWLAVLVTALHALWDRNVTQLT
jgi:hypothetical protein